MAVEHRVADAAEAGRVENLGPHGPVKRNGRCVHCYDVGLFKDFWDF